MDIGSILSSAHGIQLRDRGARNQLVQQALFFNLFVVADNGHDGLANHLFGGVPEETFCGYVPALNNTVKVVADDGIVRAVDDGFEILRLTLER